MHQNGRKTDPESSDRDSRGESILPAAPRKDLTTGEDSINRATWSGSVPEEFGTPPHIRIGKDRWFNLLWMIPLGFVLLIVGVAVAQWLRETSVIQGFIERNPGTIITPEARANAGLPWWLGAQHFLNFFLMTFILRSGAQILTEHPRLYWTRHSTPGQEWFRFQKKVPADPLWTAKEDSVTLTPQIGLPGLRHSIGLARWWHLGVDVLWLLNGLIFYILLFSTGEWRRLVPTTWDVIPNAASVLIQYLSLDWPTESSWVAYNSLQQMAYFITVFVAAPLALISGLGMSPALSTRFHRLSKLLSIQVARSIHFLVFTWFLFFIVIHVTLVFTTGLLRNLNHIYAGRDDTSWVGFIVFAATMVLVIWAWVLATPFTLEHPRVVQRVGYALIGPVQRLFEHVDVSRGAYDESDISPYFWHNGRYPDSEEFTTLQEDDFAGYRLRITGLVENPVELSLDDLHDMPHHEQITQHYCIQGWSGVAKWGGVSMTPILELVKPLAEAKWVIFYSFGEGADGGIYYDAHPIEQMESELSMLAYQMNDETLSFGHGGPLRLRNEIQLGFKQVKWIRAIEFVADFRDIGGGEGGYDQDHEFFGYRQPI